ncbi:MAG TPA: 1,6-anhydro-N-acetylmuramyl-L-alanine amidase AmpD [Nitrosomonas mobilis]|nr:1,6-anhydro-N-acetylmuramyl-L-alanine amidase AmpD [Nitrosomonas mobilis]
MKINTVGLLVDATHIPSPNCDARPDDTDISLLVIHHISLPPEEFGGDGVIELFTNRLDSAVHPYYQSLQGVRVSAHFFIRRSGEIIQFVPCLLRAWHAGVSCWKERTCCNDFSIGIELEGSENQPFTPVQYVQLARLTASLLTTYPIHDIAGHATIAPQRKTDPGHHFDWQGYRQALLTQKIVCDLTDQIAIIIHRV